MSLAAAPEGAQPEPANLGAEGAKGPTVHGDTEVVHVSSHDLPEPLSNIGYGIVQAIEQLVRNRFELGCEPLANGVSEYRVLAAQGPATNMREP